nr:collagen alpha-1(II) chain-like [Camelus dromedarius]
MMSRPPRTPGREAPASTATAPTPRNRVTSEPGRGEGRAHHAGSRTQESKSGEGSLWGVQGVDPRSRLGTCGSDREGPQGRARPRWGPGNRCFGPPRTAPAAAYSLQGKSFSSPALTSARRSPELRVRARRREAPRPTGPSTWTAGRRATTALTPRPRGRARAAAKWRRPPAPSAHPFPTGPGAALPRVASDTRLPSAVVLRAQAPSQSQAKPPPFEESIRTLPPEQPPAFLTPFPKETIQRSLQNRCCGNSDRNGMEVGNNQYLLWRF